MVTRSSSVLKAARAQVVDAVTHYDALGVSPCASADTIKAAHRGLARLLHPDRCALDNAHDLMTRVNGAYAVLSDPGARRLYDLTNKLKKVPCTTCAGRGYTYRQKGFSKKVQTPCSTCEGSGECLS